MKKPITITAFEILAVLMLLVGILSIPSAAVEQIKNSQLVFTMAGVASIMLLFMIFLVFSISRRGSAFAMWIYVLVTVAGLVLSMSQIESAWNLTASVNKQELFATGLAIVELLLLLYAYYSTDWFTTKGGRHVIATSGCHQSESYRFARQEPLIHNDVDSDRFQRASEQSVAEDQQSKTRSHISDEHKLYLIKRFNIQKLDVLDGKVSCDNKIFGSIDEALVYAAQLEADMAFSDAVKVSIDKKYGTKKSLRFGIITFCVLTLISVMSIVYALGDLETMNLRLTTSKILFSICFVTLLCDTFRKLKLRERAERRNTIVSAGYKVNIPLLIFYILLAAPAIYLNQTANERLAKSLQSHNVNTQSYRNFRATVLASGWVPYIRPNSGARGNNTYPELQFCVEDSCIGEFVSYSDANKIRRINYTICDSNRYYKCPNNPNGFEEIQNDEIITRARADEDFLRRK